MNNKQFIKNSLLLIILSLPPTSEVLAANALTLDQKNAKENVEQLEERSYQIPTDNLFEIYLSTGYRRDKLNWNEAGASVNIISELKWDNLEITQISATAMLHLSSDWNVRGKLNEGKINSGNNQDSDYNGNNRTLEFSRSNNKGGGEVRDASISLGRIFRLLNTGSKNFLTVTPLVGFSLHQQNLTMTDGIQILPATGSYSGLNSSYDAQWQGTWLGVDTQLGVGENWSLNAAAEYHWADYSADANWNMRSEFSHPVSFVHNAKGSGILLSAGANYHIRENWIASISIETQQWSTGAGIDRTYFQDGSVRYYTLNEANWESTAYNFGIAHYF